MNTKMTREQADQAELDRLWLENSLGAVLADAYQPKKPSAIEDAEAALAKLRAKHKCTRHADAWCIKARDDE